MIPEMTRFEFFESGMALVGARMGIVPINFLVKYDVYKTFLAFMSKGIRKSTAIIYTADKCYCDPSTVARYIYWFERDNKALQEAAKDGIAQTATFDSK